MTADQDQALAGDRPANRDLAELARQLAGRAPRGSLERKAYGCAAVALSTTGTLAAARRALGDVGPADVQAAALTVLEQLVSGRRSAVSDLAEVWAEGAARDGG